MSVPAQNPVTEHVGNGVTVLFPFSFLCFSKDDLQVMINLVPVDPATFTVSGLGVPSGGSITFSGPPSAGAAITIRLLVVLERETDYQTAGDLMAAVLNRDLDRIWLALQSNTVDTSSAVRVPLGESVGFLPSAAQRAKKALVFDDAGQPTVSTDDYEDQAANAAASAAQAELAKENAVASAVLAQDWATKLGSPVAGGLYSARFYALQAQTNAGLPVYQPGALPTSNVGDIFVAGAGVWRWLTSGYVPNNLPRRFRAQGDCTQTTTSATVPAGSWRAAANDCDILLAASMTKTLQASGAWAAGTGQNGLFTGARAANTWYHLFVILNPTTGAVDVGFDTSPIAANRPADWLAYRRIWSVLTDGSSNLVTMFQSGARTYYQDRRSDVSNAGVTNVSTGSTFAVGTPLGVEVLGEFALSLASGATVGVSLFKPGAIGIPGTVGDVVSSSGSQYSRVAVQTSTGGGVSARATTLITQGFYLSTVGWTDFIGD